MLSGMPEAPTPKRKPPKRKGKHGGRRAGAGRKPLPEGAGTPVTVWLPAAYIQRVVTWQDEHDCESFSEALRQLLDRASS